MVVWFERCSMQQKSKGRRLTRGYQLYVPAIFSVTLPLETTAAGGMQKKLREKKGGHFAGGVDIFHS